jgi:hypothetical protein
MGIPSIMTSAGIIKNQPPAHTRPVTAPVIMPSKIRIRFAYRIVLFFFGCGFCFRIIEYDALIMRIANKNKRIMSLVIVMFHNEILGMIGNIQCRVKSTPITAGIPKRITFFDFTRPLRAYFIPPIRLVNPTIHRE